MPQTKTQGAVFGLLMSYFMALGMEVANVAHKLGAMSNAVFLPALKETAFMGAIVFVVSMLYGSRAGSTSRTNSSGRARQPAARDAGRVRLHGHGHVPVDEPDRNGAVHGH